MKKLFSLMVVALFGFSCAELSARNGHGHGHRHHAKKAPAAKPAPRGAHVAKKVTAAKPAPRRANVAKYPAARKAAAQPRRAAPARRR